MEDKRSRVDIAFDYVVNELIEGHLQPGDRLPPEQELCTILSISRNSLREAVKQMEVCGLVHIRRPEGTYISETYNQKMLDPILYSIILQKNSWKDFIEMRRVLDIGTLSAVISSGRPLKHLDEMKAGVERMRQLFAEPEPDAKAVMACDAAFHELIEDELGNTQISTVISYITRLTIPSRTETIRKVIRDGETENFIALHEQLIDIVENRRGDLVVKAVSDHYRHWNA